MPKIIRIILTIFVFFAMVLIQGMFDKDIRPFIAGIGGGAVVFTWILLGPSKNCPECGKTLPKFRRPKSIKQALWGGWVCPNCGIEIDRKGRKVLK